MKKITLTLLLFSFTNTFSNEDTISNRRLDSILTQAGITQDVDRRKFIKRTRKFIKKEVKNVLLENRRYTLLKKQQSRLNFSFGIVAGVGSVSILCAWGIVALKILRAQCII